MSEDLLTPYTDLAALFWVPPMLKECVLVDLICVIRNVQLKLEWLTFFVV